MRMVSSFLNPTLWQLDLTVQLSQAPSHTHFTSLVTGIISSLPPLARRRRRCGWEPYGRRSSPRLRVIQRNYPQICWTIIKKSPTSPPSRSMMPQLKDYLPSSRRLKILQSYSHLAPGLRKLRQSQGLFLTTAIRSGQIPALILNRSADVARAIQCELSSAPSSSILELVWCVRHLCNDTTSIRVSRTSSRIHVETLGTLPNCTARNCSSYPD